MLNVALGYSQYAVVVLAFVKKKSKFKEYISTSAWHAEG